MSYFYTPPPSFRQNAPVAHADPVEPSHAKTKTGNDPVQNLVAKICKCVSDLFQNLTAPHIYLAYGKKLKRQAFMREIKRDEEKEGMSLNQQRVKLQCTYNQGNLFTKIWAARQIPLLNEKIKRKEKIESIEKIINAERSRMVTLGGERVTLTTPDQAQLDGVYLDPQKMRLKIKNAGGMLISYQIKTATGTMNIQGISFPKEQEKEANKIADALQNLYPNSPGGSDWQLLEDGDNVIILKTEDAAPWHIAAPQDKIKKEETIDTSIKPSGTVILSSGALGVYEMQKKEALYFLFKNMNVMLFNFRGYGESEGRPSKKGLKIDMEQAYQFAKNKSGHEDEKILFKALCMSGSPAAYVAAKHPKTNIFLDKSFANFRKLASENVGKELKNIISPAAQSDPGSFKNLLADAVASALESIAYAIFKFIIPELSVTKYLARNKGQKGVFFARDDEIIPFHHVEENIRAIANASQLHNTMLIAGSGTHSGLLIGYEDAPIDFLVKDEKNREELTALIESRNQALKDIASSIKELETIEARTKTLAYTLIDDFLEETKRAELKKNRDKLKTLEPEIVRLLPLNMAADDLNTLARKRKNARNMMDRFLEKAKLSDHEFLSSQTVKAAKP